MQKHPEGWRLVQAGSRFLTDAEANYSMVELELRGIEWAIMKCRLYLLGLQPFQVISDHSSLVPILNRQTLDAVESTRLQRMKERLTPYNFTTVWKRGKDHAIPRPFLRTRLRSIPCSGS